MKTVALGPNELKTLRIALDVFIQSERELIHAHAHMPLSDQSRMMVEKSSRANIAKARALFKKLREAS